MRAMPWMRKAADGHLLDRRGAWLPALLLALSLAAPGFAPVEVFAEFFESAGSEEIELESFDEDTGEAGTEQAHASELAAQARATSLLAHAVSLRERRHLRRMIPRAPPLA